MTLMFDLDPATLSPEARVDALVASEREIARLQARQLRVIAAIADDPCADGLAPGLDKEYFKEEIRAALGESAESVNNRLLLATELTHRLPATMTALETGAITLRHARHLADAVRRLDDADATEVEAAVLPFAEGRDFGAFCRKVRREVLKCDSRSVEEQVAAALEDRKVWMRPVQNCMSLFGALLPADGAQVLMTVLDLKADQCPADDPRTKDQRRADALVQLALDALNGYSRCPDCVASDDTYEDGSTLPRWQGMRPTVQVTVALSTLLGLDRQPGDLDGYGPIPAELALRMASEESATWRRLVTDELGRLIDYGRSTYRPPADLRDFVIARDKRCVFPTCNRKACRCDLDHVRAWADGGETNERNLVALCCRHQHGKHEAGWQLKRLADGSIEWTSPTGRNYTVPARTYPIDSTYDRYVPDDNVEHPPEDANADPPEAEDGPSHDDPPF